MFVIIIDIIIVNIIIIAKVTPSASLMFLGYETFVRIFYKFWSAHTDTDD